MTSRMHPGWAAFFLAWFSGIFTMMAMVASVQWAALRLPVGYLIFIGAVAIFLFALGGRKAERLTDRVFYLDIMNDNDAFRTLIANEVWKYQEADEAWGPFERVEPEDGDEDEADLMRKLVREMAIDQAERIRIAIMHSPMKGLML